MNKSEYAGIRFGFGLHPLGKRINGRSGLLAQLDGVDHAAQSFPIHSLDEALEKFQAYAKAAKAEKKNPTENAELVKKRNRAIKATFDRSVKHIFARAITSPDGFRERLSNFWMDHFTVSTRGRRLSIIMPTMIDSAIRPNISGKFSDMLLAVVTHPAMLIYLDQTSSIGPNSNFAKKRKGKGLNENLARELLELHTLGVNGTYTQVDVRELAELLTGIRVNAQGFRYGAGFAEPGTEYILGNSYGGASEEFRYIKEFLKDVSVHPDTARHLATKLAVHFVSDTPPPGLIDVIAARYLDTGGDLRETYDAMLRHPAAWANPHQKVKKPFDYVVSTHRAIGTDPSFFDGMKRRQIAVNFLNPMRLMGQVFLRPNGPDGWPEESEHWITPAGLAGRVQFSMQVAAKIDGQYDPRDFIGQALGTTAGETTRWASERAQSRIEGLALILASPEFNRR